MAEIQWFINATAPYSGMEINVLSEGIPTHVYGLEVLTKAFGEIIGIKVNHQVLGEGEDVKAVQTQMQTGRNLCDAKVKDSDLIGTHSRLQLAVNLTDFRAGDGAAVTNPDLDLTFIAPNLSDFVVAQYLQGNFAMAPTRFESLLMLHVEFTQDVATLATPLGKGFATLLIASTVFFVARLARKAWRITRPIRKSLVLRRVGRVDIRPIDEACIPFFNPWSVAALYHPADIFVDASQ